MKAAYASGTTVPPERSRAEIELTLTRYGAEGFAYATQHAANGASRARIEFLAHSRKIRFDLTLPPPDDPRFTRHPKYSWKTRTDAQSLVLWNAETRRLWRALLLAIKAKLEVVQSGLAIFEEEFAANIVLPDGKTVWQHVGPRIAEAYQGGRVVALLPETTA